MYNPEQILPIGEAAKKLGVSPATLRRWEEKGVITPLRTLGGERRYSTKLLENLKSNPPEDELVDIKEAAQTLGISTKSVRRLVSKGKLNPQTGKFGKLLLSRLEVEGLKENGNGHPDQVIKFIPVPQALPQTAYAPPSLLKPRFLALSLALYLLMQ